MIEIKTKIIWVGYIIKGKLYTIIAIKRSRAKKLVLVLAIFTLITRANKKDKVVLVSILCIYHPPHFCKKKKKQIAGFNQFLQ